MLGGPVGCLGMLLGGPRSFRCTGWSFRALGVLLGVLLGGHRSFGCTGWAFRALWVCSGHSGHRCPGTSAAQGGRFVRFWGSPIRGQEAEEQHPP